MAEFVQSEMKVIKPNGAILVSPETLNEAEEENRMSEQEVKIFMDENERLYAVTENGDRYMITKILEKEE